MIKINKPWGYEELLEVNDHYVMKKLYIKKGCRLSLQYHERKTETMLLAEGNVNITLNNDIINPDYLQPIHIKAGDIHRVEALEDSLILETSTTELSDVIRIEDDYKRE